jgi:photosystem II stability/assembly factor-like uncharacterized protein
MKHLVFSLVFITVFACKNTKDIDANDQLAIKIQKAFQNYKPNNVIVYSSNTYACEPSIAINPKNTNNIIAGSVLNNVHTSQDGGKTWQTAHLSSKYGVYGDPCIVIDTLGTAYYLHLSNPAKYPHGKGWLDRIVIQKSLDAGLTWSDGQGIGNNKKKIQDKAWAAIHPKTNALAVTWTEFDKYKYESKKGIDKSRIRFSYSNDKGETWSTAKTISEREGDCMDSDFTPEGAVPAIANDGTIYVSWAFNENIYFDYSLDNGATWLDNDILISKQPKGWNIEIPEFGRANGMPITAVDNSSGKHANTIYVNWADQRNGEDNTDIFIAKSTDKGKTWSKPKRVNTDNTKTHQWFTWMSVDPKTGYIYIIYYDRSAYKDNKTDLSLAISTNGGKTFNTKIISEKSFVAKGVYFMGDYNNINAYDSKIALIWTRADDKKLSVMSSIIDLKK